MFVWFGRKVQVKTVPGGRVEHGRCPQCGDDARFRECIATKTWTAYSVLDLVDSEERVFRCSECAELLQLTPPPEKVVDPATKAKLLALKARRAKLEMALRAKERAVEASKVRKKANTELSELKRKMGL